MNSNYREAGFVSGMALRKLIGYIQQDRLPHLVLKICLATQYSHF